MAVCVDCVRQCEWPRFRAPRSHLPTSYQRITLRQLLEGIKHYIQNDKSSFCLDVCIILFAAAFSFNERIASIFFNK